MFSSSSFPVESPLYSHYSVTHLPTLTNMVVSLIFFFSSLWFQKVMTENPRSRITLAAETIAIQGKSGSVLLVFFFSVLSFSSLDVCTLSCCCRFLLLGLKLCLMTRQLNTIFTAIAKTKIAICAMVKKRRQ